MSWKPDPMVGLAIAATFATDIAQAEVALKTGHSLPSVHGILTTFINP